MNVKDMTHEQLKEAAKRASKPNHMNNPNNMNGLQLSIKDIKMVVNAYQQLKNSFENITDEELLSIKDLLYW